MKTQILLLVFGLVVVVSAAPHHGRLHNEILKLRKGAEKALEAFIQEVNPEDVEKVMSEEGVTEEDATEAGEEAEDAGEEAEAEVEKGNVSENDAENWFESTFGGIEDALQD